ncbi:hypothetical protein CRENBAI_006826 [Crenichthys baileyi]|uniref:Uncharacterized protein n=1 Tax=Crenichthys baileyi TaxID=28760 RepID=A0AAV9SJA5_9TELE
MDRIGVSFLDPLEDYELIHRIGCGTYGDVFKVAGATDLVETPKLPSPQTPSPAPPGGAKGVPRPAKT